MRLGIHEKWNAWFTTTRFDACGVEFHVPIKPSLPKDSFGILCFVVTWEFNLDGIQLICIFDASVWISLDVIYLDELIHICKDVRTSQQEGVWKYMDLPCVL